MSKEDYILIADIKFEGSLISTKGMFSQLIEVYKYNSQFYQILHAGNRPRDYELIEKPAC